MKNKKAQFFGIYLVLLVLVMCGMVIMMYFKEQNNIKSSLVSPVLVLELRDNLEMFELKESEIVNMAFIEAKKEETFGSDGFIEKFREEFFILFNSDPKMRLFIEKDLIINSKRVFLSEEDYNLFLENYLYPRKEIFFNGDKLLFSRAKIEKGFKLNNGDIQKIKFPVEFRFEFDKKYVIEEGEVKL